MRHARLTPFALLLAAGCATAGDPSFDRASRTPADPRQPIVGAWQGDWANEDGTAGGPARVVVAAAVEHGVPTDRFAMQLDGFPLAAAGEGFAAEAVVDPRAGPVHDFAAKVPSYVTDGLCAVAVGLQAHADGDRMTIQYWANDALQQVDAGTITLRRVSPSATTRP